jgi:tetratricopeptide (TPR) repeat protein
MTKRFDRLSTAAALVAALALAAPAAAQLNLPRPSPGATVKQTIGLTDVTVEYSRPGVKGRAIWGDLVPYDKPWRTGANASTTIQLSDEVTIGGKKVPAGTYSLYTVPGKAEWTVVLNSDPKAQPGSWDEKKDVARVAVKPAESPEFHEWMSFEFEALTPRSGELALYWEKLRVPLKIEVDTDAKALASARDAVAKAKADDWRTPMQAANYMVEQKSNQEDAGKWLEKSISVQENYYNVSAKARYLAAAGKKKEAMAAAEKALSLAPKTEPKPSEENVANLKKQMAEWSAKG